TRPPSRLLGARQTSRSVPPVHGARHEPPEVCNAPAPVYRTGKERPGGSPEAGFDCPVRIGESNCRLQLLGCKRRGHLSHEGNIGRKAQGLNGVCPSEDYAVLFNPRRPSIRWAGPPPRALNPPRHPLPPLPRRRRPVPPSGPRP